MEKTREREKNASESRDVSSSSSSKMGEKLSATKENRQTVDERGREGGGLKYLPPLRRTLIFRGLFVRGRSTLEGTRVLQVGGGSHDCRLWPRVNCNSP